MNFYKCHKENILIHVRYTFMYFTALQEVYVYQPVVYIFGLQVICGQINFLNHREELNNDKVTDNHHKLTSK